MMMMMMMMMMIANLYSTLLKTPLLCYLFRYFVKWNVSSADLKKLELSNGS